MSRELKVKDYCGAICMSYEKGEHLFEQISPLVKEGEKVTLNFDGVRLISSAFLNSAIGSLFQYHEGDFIRDHLDFINVPNYSQDTIQIVMDHAERYFNDPQYRNSLNDNFFKELDEY